MERLKIVRQRLTVIARRTHRKARIAHQVGVLSRLLLLIEQGANSFVKRVGVDPAAEAIDLERLSGACGCGLETGLVATRSHPASQLEERGILGDEQIRFE